MRVGSILATVAGFLVVASSQAFAATTYLGGGWYSGTSWSGGTVPTLADDVIIPTGNTVTLNAATGAKANTISLVGTAVLIIDDDNLEVDGGGGGNSSSTVTASNGIRLVDANSELKLSGTQTWTGTGSIRLEHQSATIHVTSGATWTIAFNSIRGFGTIDGIGGTGALQLNSIVFADSSSGVLAFGSNLAIDDSSSASWLTTFGGGITFNHAATGLEGLFRIGSATFGPGTLVINANVTTTGVFEFGCGSLQVGSGSTFTYSSYTPGGGTCPNPGSGVGPYAVEEGTYGCEC